LGGVSRWLPSRLSRGGTGPSGHPQTSSRIMKKECAKTAPGALQFLADGDGRGYKAGSPGMALARRAISRPRSGGA